MVYRGKPSAGCDNCRKAKKRCDLEQPACTRCVKLKKTCSGYRDTSQLQIQDESEAVKQKALRSKARQAVPQAQSASPPALCRDRTPDSSYGILTPAHSDSSSSNDGVFDISLQDVDDEDAFRSTTGVGAVADSLALVPTYGKISYTYVLRQDPEALAMNHFFNQFANPGWEFILSYANKPRTDPCLELAMKACGMAALGNVENVIMGHDYARAAYVEALSLLNAALRDPKRSRTDDSLIAVTMLGYYENLTCDSRESIQSWKAHMSGATQLLRIRGKQQFKTQAGRMLFRETRVQILTHCIWDDMEPPAFLWEWEEELERQTAKNATNIAVPADDLVKVTFDFATLRAKFYKNKISPVDAMEEASSIESRFIQWSINTPAKDEWWRFTDAEVPDSPHVWNGTVHAYAGHPAPGVWNTLRVMRILLTRTQEQLCQQFQFSDAEREEQRRYFRKVRRQMMDEICSTIPCTLGHAAPFYSSSCVLISAYGSIWPLFFAGTCALERVGTSAWQKAQEGSPGYTQTSAASVQAAWILSRLEYISTKVGLRWANGIGAVLRGDFSFHDDLLPESNIQPSWTKRIENLHRGPRALLQPESVTDEELDRRKVLKGPIWVGRGTGENPQVG